MSSQAISLARPASSTLRVQARPAARARLAYIDNLRVFLVILVIVHHLAVTYGGEGAWHYTEGRADLITSTVLTLFVAVNQAFFMGFYFAIAGYFVPRSLERKGSRQYLKDRFLRLGVPLVFQILVVGPLISYILGLTWWGFEGSFWANTAAYWRKYQGLDTGSLWFVEALLIFSLLYTLWWHVARPAARTEARITTPPGNAAIAMSALTVGLLTFAVRIWLPVGWYFVPLNFQFPHFAQYIGLFVMGTVAYRRGWLGQLSADAARGRLWGRVVLFLLLLAPVLFVAGGALEGSTDAFRGGIHWQSLAYAVWEQFLCVGMVIGLLNLFRRRFDFLGRLGRTLAGSAYAVYILHTTVLVVVSLALRPLEVYPLLKFLLAASTCVPLCFAIGGLARRLPLARSIL